MPVSPVTRQPEYGIADGYSLDLTAMGYASHLAWKAYDGALTPKGT